MNFDEFIARVVDEMRSRLLRQGDGSDIRVNKVLKNNGGGAHCDECVQEL